MLLLTAVVPLVCAIQEGFHCFSPAMMRQFSHPWGGFTVYDLIMPLFIFMCGAAIPFALGRRLREGKGLFWRHVLARVVLLWVLGGCIAGHWLELDSHTFRPIGNTLHAIAIGYAATAVMMTVPQRWFQIVLPIALAVLYAALMGGDYSQTGNLAYRVEQACRAAVLPADNVSVTNPSHYTWVLTSLMFASMTMCGYHAARILLSAHAPWRKALTLAAFGAALLAVGWAAVPWVPMIKQVFSLSFTAQAMGWSVLLLAALYVLCDIWKIRRGSALVLLFGQCALASYVVWHLFYDVLHLLARTLGSGLIRLCGPNFGPTIVTFLSIVEMIAVMAVWRKIKSGK